MAVALKSREPANPAKLDDTQRKQLRQSLLERKQGEVVQKRLDELKKAAQIEIAPQVQALLDKETQEEKKP